MHPEEYGSETPPSKTRRKKEMHALQHVGSRLTRFSEAQLDKLPLPDKLRNAIREHRRLPNSHGARRRQLQYIGRLMRDFDLDEIETEIESMLRPPRTADKEKAQLQRHCDQILAGGDPAINDLLTENSQLERQVLRKHYLDFSKARSNDDESGCNTVEARLKAYLDSRLA